MSLESNGDLRLDNVPRPEDCRGECRVSLSRLKIRTESLSYAQVIDLRNYAPFFTYKPGYILGGDVPGLLDEGYLRVVYLERK